MILVSSCADVNSVSVSHSVAELSSILDSSQKSLISTANRKSQSDRMVVLLDEVFEVSLPKETHHPKIYMSLWVSFFPKRYASGGNTFGFDGSTFDSSGINFSSHGSYFGGT